MTQKSSNIALIDVKLFLLNNLLTLAGLIMLIISFIVSWGNWVDYKTNKEDHQITVKIIEAPTSCKNITKRGGYCKLEYNGEVFIKKAGRKFCHLVSGKKEVTMLINKREDNLLFVGEYNNFEFSTGFILAIIAFGIMIKGYKPLRKI